MTDKLAEAIDYYSNVPLNTNSNLSDLLDAALQSPRVPVIEILETVLEQAEDEGLWFNAKYASEAYLQQELRRLHAIIERAYAELRKGN